MPLICTLWLGSTLLRHSGEVFAASDTLNLPQVAETNTPCLMDADGKCLLYDEFGQHCSHDTIQFGGMDWNDAVKAYNTRRAQIKGEIVARVSAYLEFQLTKRNVKLYPEECK